MENTYGNDTGKIKEHFKDIKEKYKIEMGVRRFIKLRNSFIPSIEEIREIIDCCVEKFQTVIKEAPIVTVDETVYEYDPSKEIKDRAEICGEPIPIQHFLLKPHDCGLVVYNLSTAIEIDDRSYPFSLDFIPHLKIGDVTPQGSIIQMIKR